MASPLHLSKFVVGFAVLIKNHIPAELLVLQRMFNYPYFFIRIVQNTAGYVGEDDKIVAYQWIDKVFQDGCIHCVSIFTGRNVMHKNIN